MCYGRRDVVCYSFLILQSVYDKGQRGGGGGGGGTSDLWITLSGWTFDMSLRYWDFSFRRSMS